MACFFAASVPHLPMILNVPINPLLSASPPPTKTQVKTAVGRACNHAPGEVDPVALGCAGKRSFWAPYVLKIDGKNYIPFFDPRRQNGLTAEARRFVFSINHTHIRLLNPTGWGDVGFVIFQFENSRKGAREAIPHFDNGIKFWTDTEIGGMIDEIYRILDEIRRAA